MPSRRTPGSVALLLATVAVSVRAFSIDRLPSSTYSSYSSSSSSSLGMGGFNKRKKRAAVYAPTPTTPPADDDADDAASIKERNDRRRFEDLLNDEATSAISADALGGGGSYLTREQEDEEIDARIRRTERLYEGDPVPEAAFASLVNVVTEKPLGAAGADNLLPWKKKGRKKDAVVCVSDPREKSVEFRRLLRELPRTVPSGTKTIFITSDPPAATRKWIKKNGVEDVRVYSDEKREWMREFTALGDKRWAVCLFVLAEGRIQSVIRELDADLAGTAVPNAVRSWRS